MIVEYAKSDPTLVTEDCAHVEIFIDRDGEYWGMAIIDGSHRLAAAKLKGAHMVPIERLLTAADVDLPKVPFSVREIFSKTAGARLLYRKWWLWNVVYRSFSRS